MPAVATRNPTIIAHCVGSFHGEATADQWGDEENASGSLLH